MFLRDQQLFRKILIASMLFMSHSALVTRAYPLDLKVDLPPNAGKEPVLYYNPIVNQQADANFNNNKNSKDKEGSLSKKQQKIAKKSEQINQENEGDFPQSNDMEDLSLPPPPPSLAVEKNKSLKKQKIEAPQDKSNIVRLRQMRDGSLAQDQKIQNNSPELAANHNPFPMLACIKDNVKFWERVYTEIDLNEAFLHDRNNLSRVYASISLPQNKAQRSTLMDQERERYSKILDSLSKKVKLSPKKWTKEEIKLAKLFKKNELTSKNLQEAKANLRFQTGLKSQFEEGVQRSINYLPSVYPIVKKSGLPIELALLPHVESSYNSKAGSKVGAMGLWQIMPATMRMFEGGAAVNKRTDPVISTRAAMKILKNDFDKIQNWPLTLTAYNHGVNGMLRAIDETGSRDLCKVIDHYSSPSFQFASSNFYAQFLAARQVAMKRYAVLAKKGKGESSLVLRRTVLSSKGGSLK